MMHEEAKALVKELRKRRVYKDGVRRQPRKHEREAADIITRLKGYAAHGKRSDGEACSAAWVKGADCDCGLSALLEEIDRD